MRKRDEEARNLILRFSAKDRELHDSIRAAAEAEHMSLNGFILRAVQRDLKRGKAMDLVIEAAERHLT